MEEKKVKTREKEIEELLKDSDLQVMTECAYGKTIADSENDKKKKKKE